MRKFIEEFKAFIAKGNVMDMAVAVIIGSAFGKIVSSLVDDVIMPLISLIVGNKSVADWKWVITPADEAAGTAETALRYGIFIQNIIDFLIVALVIFIVLKVFLAGKSKLERLIHAKEDEAAETAENEAAPEETELDILREIRDALTKNDASGTKQ